MFPPYLFQPTPLLTERAFIVNLTQPTNQCIAYVTVGDFVGGPICSPCVLVGALWSFYIMVGDLVILCTGGRFGHFK